MLPFLKWSSFYPFVFADDSGYAMFLLSGNYEILYLRCALIKRLQTSPPRPKTVDKRMSLFSFLAPVKPLSVFPPPGIPTTVAPVENLGVV